MLQASDPDVGDDSQLVYSLAADSPYFDVEPSSGLVYVVSAVGLSGQLAEVEVKATDPRGLYATTKVEVSVVRSGENFFKKVRTGSQRPLKSTQVWVKTSFSVICQLLKVESRSPTRPFISLISPSQRKRTCPLNPHILSCMRFEFVVSTEY